MSLSGHRELVSAALAAMDVEDAEHERRYGHRKPASAMAVIVSPELPAPVGCIVRDTSATGARLTLTQSGTNPAGTRAKLPARFTLVIRMDRIEVDCAIAWRHCGDLGVRFLAAPRVLAPVKGH